MLFCALAIAATAVTQCIMFLGSSFVWPILMNVISQECLQGIWFLLPRFKKLHFSGQRSRSHFFAMSSFIHALRLLHQNTLNTFFVKGLIFQTILVFLKDVFVVLRSLSSSHCFLI